MLRTLFYVAHEIGGVPVFGWGWALAVWLLICCGMSLLGWRRGASRRELLGQLPMMLLVAAVLVFVLPRIEEPVTDTWLVIPPVPATSGLPVRGYGVMLLLAVVGGISLAVVRARRAGLSSELILNLAFVLVIGGIVGARLFFIVEYWNELQGETWRQTLGNLLSVDKGGLVVYGSLLGAIPAFLFFCRQHRLPPLPLADLIAPSLALGLAVGRLGCLLNGCCFGGPCELPWALRFPPHSPPHVDQHGWGLLHGLHFAEGPAGSAIIGRMDPHGPWAASALRVGDHVVAINGQRAPDLASARRLLEQSGAELDLTLAGGSTLTAHVARWPTPSLPIHPTQLYSAINGLLLCLLTLAIYPYRRWHGEVIAWLLSLYAVTRFLEEVIRSDEPGFVRGLTISQTISLLVGLTMVAFWAYLLRWGISVRGNFSANPRVQGTLRP